MDNAEKEITIAVEHFRKLTASDQQAVMELIDLLLAAQEAEKAENPKTARCNGGAIVPKDEPGTMCDHKCKRATAQI